MFCIATERTTCNRGREANMVAGTGKHHSGERLTGARSATFCSAAQRQTMQRRRSFCALCRRRGILRNRGLLNSTSPPARSEGCVAIEPNSGHFDYRSPRCVRGWLATSHVDRNTRLRQNFPPTLFSYKLISNGDAGCTPLGISGRL